jgi:choline dehydrogenase-like flavoprotein
MLIDLNTYDGTSDVKSDVCIVGAGAAGITLALELDGTPSTVCVLESGGLDYDFATQSLAAGKNVGMPYYDLIAARLRFLGGTTNHWAGLCRPLDALDFERREAVANSGWPIARADLDGYYVRAHEYCKLGDYNYDPLFWATPDAPLLPMDGGPFRTAIKLQNPVRFGRVYRDRLQASRNVQLFLSANATNVETTGNGAAVSRVHARTLAGKEIRVSAKHFVIAAGAVENARILLSSNRVRPRGIGNDHDLVGRYFMEHLMVPNAEIQFASPRTNLSLYAGAKRDGFDVVGYLTLAPEVLRREELHNICASVKIGALSQNMDKSEDGIASAFAIWNSIKEGRVPHTLDKHVANVLSDLDRIVIFSYERAFERASDIAAVTLVVEQAPNPSSRVKLADDVDSLGMRRAELDWQLGDGERRTVKRFSELLGLEMGRTGLGRVRLLEAGENGWWAGQQGAWHHMGTTRMHSDPVKGVVNADCRVHDTGNLYIAGSSVFTTGGFTNPTLTIVALAVRLADHLKGLSS